MSRPNMGKSFVVSTEDIEKKEGTGGSGGITQQEMETYVLEQTASIMEQADGKINSLMQTLSGAQNDILELTQRVEALEKPAE